MPRGPKLLPRTAQPTDLVFLLVCCPLLGAILILLEPYDTFLSLVFGLPFLLLLPGYGFVSALFPENRLRTVATQLDDNRSELFFPHELDLFERLALSVGTSIIIVPAVVFCLDYSPVPISTASVVLSVCAVTVLLTVVAIWRRQRLPEDDRFTVETNGIFVGIRSELVAPQTRLDLVLNVIVVVSVVVAVLGTGYIFIDESQPEEYTAFYLLSEDETGQLVAGEYPSSLAEVEQSPPIVGVDNHEGDAVEYTLVVILDEIEQSDGTVEVVDSQEVARYSETVENGDSWQTESRVAIDAPDAEYRLTFRLYTDTPPADPTAANTDHELHLWLTEDQTGSDSAVDRSSQLEFGTETMGGRLSSVGTDWVFPSQAGSNSVASHPESRQHVSPESTAVLSTKMVSTGRLV